METDTKELRLAFLSSLLHIRTDTLHLLCYRQAPIKFLICCFQYFYSFLQLTESWQDWGLPKSTIDHLQSFSQIYNEAESREFLFQESVPLLRAVARFSLLNIRLDEDFHRGNWAEEVLEE